MDSMVANRASSWADRLDLLPILEQGLCHEHRLDESSAIALELQHEDLMC